MTEVKKKKKNTDRTDRLKKKGEKVLSVDISEELYNKLDILTKKNKTHTPKRYLIEMALKMLFEEYKDELK